MKAAMLKGYVNECAAKIQKVFKGFYSRKVVLPIKKSFAKGRGLKLDSVVKGWRIRRIMNTKEIENHINQIKDYQIAMNDLVGDMTISERRVQLQKALEISRYNTVSKMISLI
jgi:hypothetical protein